MFFFAHGVDLGFAPRAPRYINSIHNEHHLSNLHAIFYLFYLKKKSQSFMGVSENSGFSPQIIHFNRVFHYKPSILGVFPPFLETSLLAKIFHDVSVPRQGIKTRDSGHGWNGTDSWQFTT